MSAQIDYVIIAFIMAFQALIQTWMWLLYRSIDERQARTETSIKCLGDKLDRFSEVHPTHRDLERSQELTDAKIRAYVGNVQPGLH